MNKRTQQSLPSRFSFLKIMSESSHIYTKTKGGDLVVGLMCPCCGIGAFKEAMPPCTLSGGWRCSDGIVMDGFRWSAQPIASIRFNSLQFASIRFMFQSFQRASGCLFVLFSQVRELPICLPQGSRPGGNAVTRKSQESSRITLPYLSFRNPASRPIKAQSIHP